MSFKSKKWPIEDYEVQEPRENTRLTLYYIVTCSYDIIQTNYYQGRK